MFNNKKISKAPGFRGLQCVKEIVCQRLLYFMDRSMSIIDDGHELERILESMNLDEYELINSPMEQQQPGDLSHEHAVGMASTSDTESMLGLAPNEGSSTELCSGVDPCQGSSMR